MFPECLPRAFKPQDWRQGMSKRGLACPSGLHRERERWAQRQSFSTMERGPEPLASLGLSAPPPDPQGACPPDPSLDPTASLWPLVPHPTQLPLPPTATCDLPCLLPTAPPLTNILAETQSHRPRFFWPCPLATPAICFPRALLDPVINQDMLPQENVVIGDATRAQRGWLTCSLPPHAPPCSTRPLSPPLPPSLP